MTATSPSLRPSHEPQLLGQTVVVIGGSAGIGLETARRAREEGADVILTARDPDRLRRVGLELGAPASRPSTRPTSSGSGSSSTSCPRRSTTCWSPDPVPTTRRWRSSTSTRHAETSKPISCCRSQVARHALGKVRPGGTLLFMGGTGGRRTAPGFAFISALTAALPALTKNLALELAPIRVNLIAAGFVDTPLSAAILGDQLDARREQLRTTLPIRRVVGPADIAALAVHLMTNTAVTGATFDIDGGQQLVEG